MLKIFWLAAWAACACSVNAADPELDLMPWPKEVTAQPGAVAIGADFNATLSGAGAEDARAKAALPRFLERMERQTGVPLTALASAPKHEAVLTIEVQTQDHAAPQRLGDDESYRLVAANGHVQLTAKTALGALRGMETILQLVRQNQSPAEPGFSIPNVTIHDEPRFPWRGLSFDVVRHFMPMDVVKRTLDAMAAVKLNVFHWHLSDDEGFRVESKVFPRLTEVGSDGMFYTQEDVREILAYAAARGIRVVPEFDMPGHATSWLVAYPELASVPGPFTIVHDHHNQPTKALDPIKESTYDFLDKFIGEMTALFPDEFFHVGGDEVIAKQWNGVAHIREYMAAHKMAATADLQAYFSRRVLEIVTRHGKHMVGWDEVLNPELPKTAVVQSWRGQASLWMAARKGYQGILSAGYYLDLSYPASFHYAVDPMTFQGKRADLTPEQQKLILGGEAATWEELASVEMIDARLWPRLAAIAERFWSQEDVTDLGSMYRRLKVTNDWLEWLGTTQKSNLKLMRQRLAGPFPVGPLDELASLVEPTKGYSRHAQLYGIFSPLNRLSFAIPYDSDAAREFRDAVDDYLAAPKTQRHSALLRASMTRWAAAMKDVRPMLEKQTILTENLPVAEGISALCETGLQAIDYLEGAGASAVWKKQAAARVDLYVNKRFGDLLIQIAPGVQKLVAAVPAK